MSEESNIDSIRALDEKIKEQERVLIKLKRARNSFLNVSKLPPEVLGNIFRWNVTLKGDFGGLNKISHNFLLVCHRWFEVASRTPELWSFWGSTLEDWARWCRHSGYAPLDLVLNGGEEEYFTDDPLADALQDRATRDTIRRIHLSAKESGLLHDIITLLTPTCEGVRSSSVASFILLNWDHALVNVSDFFARHHFPKLQRLRLHNCTISSWDCLMSRTAVLTTLDLDFATPLPAPSTSQLFSIFSSNPALQEVKLGVGAVPGDDDKSSFQVKLHHLKNLELEGDLRYVIRLLQRLDHPRNMDRLRLTLCDCDMADVSQIIGPYLRDYLQRRDRSQNGLCLSISAGYNYQYRGSQVTLHAGDAGGINLFSPALERKDMFVAITLVLKVADRRDIVRRAGLGLIVETPREDVVYLHTNDDPVVMEDTYTQFPNLREFSSSDTPLSNVFPNPNLIGDDKIFPSLEHVRLKPRFGLTDDWSPLVTFLEHRASSGNRLDTLVIDGSAHLCPGVEKGIRSMVREFIAPKVDRLARLSCPYGTCK